VCSVEGSTIIIASCIPILQPLVKFVLDRNAFSSARRSTGYNSRNNHNKPTNASDIALSNDLVRSGKASARAKIGVSHLTEIDSQERILQEAERPTLERGQSNESGGSRRTRIKRVDEVTVSSSPLTGWNDGGVESTR